MHLASCRKFRWRRPCGNSTSSAVIAHARVIDDGHVVHIDIVNNRRVHARDRAVVEEGAVMPVTAHVARTDVAIAVVHAAIKANVRTPITPVPQVTIVVEAPITGRP